MTYSLPFGLKQKPLNHYFEHGVIKFSVSEGKLYFYIKQINKRNSGSLLHGIVKSQEHLDKLMSIKTISEIPTIEVVQH